MAAVLFLALPTLTRAQTIAYGDSVALGNGVATTWVEVDADQAPLRIGVSLSESVLTGLPHTARYHSLELPRIAADSFFQHVLVDWMPHGHSPSGIYGRPHFDIHFYMISAQERRAIPAGTDPVPVAPAFMPKDYIPVPGEGAYAIPEMGVHYVDSEAPELNGQSFTQTLIYGFYRGKMLFVEPMITREYLLTHPRDSLAIKQPEAYQRSAYYPTVYQIRHDPDRAAIDVSISGFVWREQTTVSTEVVPAVAPTMLFPGFPNPFTHSTTINYLVATPGRVVLEVFDLLGRRVAGLVDEYQPVGSHSATWVPAQLPSGVYYVRLTTGRTSTAKNVLLLRGDP